MAKKELTTVGRAEKVAFPAAGLLEVPAKLDTGAYRSSVWAIDIIEQNGRLHFKIMGDLKTSGPSKEITIDKFEIVDVENSFGQSEQRYSVYLVVRLCGRRVRTDFTLSDRSMKTYPVLLGRKLLRGKFIVDVSKGSPIPDEENGK